MRRRNAKHLGREHEREVSVRAVEGHHGFKVRELVVMSLLYRIRADAVTQDVLLWLAICILCVGK